MALFKKIFYNTASLFPVDLLKKIGALDLLLPYHHLVSDERLPHICHLYSYKNQKQFRADLDYLLSHFVPINPQDLIAVIRNGGQIKKNSFLLSFDDGFRESYDIVRPILKEKGVPAIFFLNPAFLDNRELCFRNKLSLIIEAFQKKAGDEQIAKQLGSILNMPETGSKAIEAGILQINYHTRPLADALGNALGLSFGEYLKNTRPYLSMDQIQSMADEGFCFGAHSVDHPNYVNLSVDEQITQTTDSCQMIRDWFGLNYSVFSFPHDDAVITQLFFDKLFSSDGRNIDVLFGIQNQKTELNNRMLHRFNSERPDIPIDQLVKGILLYNLKARKAVRA